eukprot:scaffold351770_cov40-Prasinocladus_malaysianus.AAC.1
MSCSEPSANSHNDRQPSMWPSGRRTALILALNAGGQVDRPSRKPVLRRRPAGTTAMGRQRRWMAFCMSLMLAAIKLLLGMSWATLETYRTVLSIASSSFFNLSACKALRILHIKA